MIELRIIVLLIGLNCFWMSYGQPSCTTEGTAAIDLTYNPMARINDLITSHPAQTLLDMEAEDNNLKLSNDTEVLSLPPGAASEKWIWDEIAKNN